MLFSSYECNLKHLNKDVGLRLSNFTLPYPIKPYQVDILRINAFKNCKHAIQYIQIWLKGFLSNLFLSTYAININKSMPAWLLPTSLMLPNRLIFYEGLHTPFTNLLINILSSFSFWTFSYQLLLCLLIILFFHLQGKLIGIIDSMEIIYTHFILIHSFVF